VQPSADTQLLMPPVGSMGPAQARCSTGAKPWCCSVRPEGVVWMVILAGLLVPPVVDVGCIPHRHGASEGDASSMAEHG
jgi:hypothetical protein